MNMKRSRTGIAVFLAAALSMMLLTACSGGGTGGGGTSIAPIEFKSTKMYKHALEPETENKSFYTEYWLGSNSSGEWVEDKDFLLKVGSQNGKTYTDTYSEGVFMTTIVSDGTKTYQVYSKEAQGYDGMVQIAESGGAVIPKGKSVYFDADRVVRETTGGSTDGGEMVGGISQLKESDVIVTIGTYRDYYAEIFTWKSDPEKSLTVAYDDKDEIKAMVGVDHDKVTAVFFKKYEFDSPQFNSARLSLSYYNAMDITEEYIAGMKKLM